MKKSPLIFPAVFALFTLPACGADAAWWNKEWTGREPLTLDAAAAGLAGDAGGATVLLRLSDGNFPFAAAREDGGDLRFIAADGKTILPHEIAGYDSLLNEAFVWVRLPEVKAGAKETFHVYFGNAQAPAAPVGGAYDADTALVYHFSERGAAPVDSTPNRNNAATAGLTAESSLAGGGLRLAGGAPLTIPDSASLQWRQGQALTLATWIKPAALQERAVLLERAHGAAAFRLLLDQGVPAVEIATGGAPVRSPAGAPLAAAAWSHLAVVADGTSVRIFLNGEPYAAVDGALPALETPLTLGGPATASPGTNGYIGELDELSISTTARSAAWLRLAAVNQGPGEAGQRLLAAGPVEGGGAGEQSHLMEHLSLFGDIARNMMFDGWIAIGVCAVMIVIGWTVAVRKFLYLNSIEKGTKAFLSQWKTLSTDLTALEDGDEPGIRSLGGNADASVQQAIARSPLYHIYQIGSEEIRHRLAKDGTRVEGLNGRSIQAIRASLDAGLVHESHRLSDGLVYLTISIAGGPYVGLLGTVVGVMITFAIIAKSGEVNVNSIAPGIASALLATVVGLVVAIPALFIYSYLNGRIKNSLALMQVFIDEFVAKMAEFYRPANESDYTGGGSSH